jgi:hypothetical protein
MAGLGSMPVSRTASGQNGRLRPSTPTMAAMPMLMPRADSTARTRRLRRQRVPNCSGAGHHRLKRRWQLAVAGGPQAAQAHPPAIFSIAGLQALAASDSRVISG